MICCNFDKLLLGQERSITFFLFLQLYNFFAFLMDHFTPASSESKTFFLSLVGSQGEAVKVEL